MTPRPSVLASFRLLDGLLRISGGTVLDSLLHRYSHDRSDERLAWWARRVVTSARMDLRVIGRENLLHDERFVIMSNHQSHLDVPTLFHALSPRMRMVAKKELFRFPIWGSAMRQSGFVEIDRGNREQAIESLNEARRVLDQGFHVWIAPEGTRSPSGDLLPFKKGGFMLALGAGARILPVGILGTRDALPVHATRVRVGVPVTVAIGAPIDTRGKERDALVSETRSAIEALVAQARDARPRA